jgi:hypothetical protein
MNSVALVIIYNHQYNKNIDILERIYGERFSNIYHLVPFYNGVKKNVIPVYENSHYFQGYVAQAVNVIFDKKFDHYFFIADDLFLNPCLTQENYVSFLHLTEDASFLPSLITLHERETYWHRLTQAALWNPNVPGVEVAQLLPTYEEAMLRFKKYDLEISPLSFYQVMNKQPSSEEEKNVRFQLRYPLVGSYSDIFVVSRKTIKHFSHLCGLFAATRLFVELAIPTALVLAAEDIVTESEIITYGRTLWDTKDYELLERYNYSLLSLIKGFPDQHLYIHPIKLSKWDTAL